MLCCFWSVYSTDLVGSWKSYCKESKNEITPKPWDLPYVSWKNSWDYLREQDIAKLRFIFGW